MHRISHTRHPSIFLISALVLLTGGLLGALLSSWADHPVFGDTRRVPVYLARTAAADASNSGNPMGFASILKPALPAVVNISSSRNVKQQPNPFSNDPFFGPFFGNRGQTPPRRVRGIGSGVIISPDGYILTNNHVVDQSTELKVVLTDKREFKGKVIGTDPKTDIAVVKIDATLLPTFTLGDSSRIEVGDYALAIGDPFGIGETATMGIVSATGRGNLDIEDYEDFIQTDASINPGNSGGALINARSELIGINTAILAGQGGGNQGIGFAVPINLARYVMDQILKHGKVVRGYLGIAIQELTPDLAKAFNVPIGKGALVGDVTPNGPAAKAGLQKGDVIIQMDGKEVDGPNQLKLEIASRQPENLVHLKVIHNGQPLDVSVPLGELPEKGAEAAPGASAEKSALRGIQVDELTPQIASDLGLPPDTKGVVVTEVDADSPAADAGLRQGDVIQEINRKPVTSVSAYQKLARAAGQNPVLLSVNRRGTTTFVALQPAE